MQDYAVIKIAHRQYIVEPGKSYTVDKFAGEVGTKVTFPVLAQAKKGELSVGTPNVGKVAAEIEITDQGKGEKIKTFVYKAKSRYRRRYGLRKRTTTFKVISIK